MKKIISALLTAAMAVSAVTAVPFTASAASSSWQSDTEMMSLLSALDIMVGDDNGNFNLDSYVTRAEMTKIAVAASSSKNTVAIGMKFSPFSDVGSTFWGAPYIQAAVSAGIVNGYIDGTFRPDGTVTYEEAITMMLRVLGYESSDFGASYPYGQVGMANNLEMTENMYADIGEPLTRRQVAHLVCNTLDTSMKASTNDLISVHNCTILSDVTIIASQADDATLASDEISTTSGKYRIKDDYFDDGFVGCRGDMVIKDGKYYVAFSPDSSYASDKYVIYSTLNDAILAYPDGNNTNIRQFTISDTTTCYMNSTAYTYGSLRSQMEMGDTIRIRYKDNGEVDYINYSKGSMDGPIKVTSSSWINRFAADSSTKIMRDGTKASASDIMTNDIVYYSSALNMVLAYSKKVTGVYESASPSKDSPQSVTVSGVTYQVEGVEAFNDLSSSGSLNYGDTITLLMGKDGLQVAGVVTNTAASTDSVVGYVTASGKDTFNNPDGTTYTSYYVNIVTPDGTSYKYPTEYDKSSNVNKVVRASVVNGYATINALTSNTSLSGYVSYAKMQIGSKAVASDVKILDISKIAGSDTTAYTKTYIQRIDGITLSSSNVVYYATNTSGAVSELILQNVTGDMYQYGMVMSSSTQSAGEDATYKTYSILSDNATYSASRFSLTAGIPVQFAASSSTATYAVSLKSYSGTVSELTQVKAVIGSNEYLLSDKVKVFNKLSGLGYLEMSLNDAINGDYSYTCYYDKTEENGGRIRVIVCESK
ncbi:MAG: S-layer homology domain-containing protein [Candidatus Ornithomonoglobus sp.]